MHSTPCSIAVFCGSLKGNDTVYTDAALRVGQWIGQQGGELVYGGGGDGLMGVVARACLDAGGRIYGVIPHRLVEKEHAFHEGHQLFVVETMQERKTMMAQRAQAFLILPGGIGTFEEFFEVWSGRHLDYHAKPLGLLNTEGYYQGLLSFLKSCAEKALMRPGQMELLQISDHPEDLLAQLVAQIHPAPPNAGL